QGDGASLPYRDLLADDKIADGGAVQPPATSTLPEPEEGALGSFTNDQADAADEAGDEYDLDGDREKWSDDDAAPRGKRFEDKDEKKAHKASVKEEKRERRKEKMPKHVKKKLVGQGGRGKK
ncbi:Serine/threonine-protein kinase rio1, partial [Friedmanniomyces endolithicus]